MTNLKYNKALPLVDDANLKEYWNYLYSYKKTEDSADGLLIFIYDLYSNVNRKEMQKEFIDLTIKIRELLL